MRHLFKHLFAFTVAANATCSSALETQVRLNPAIPGWHSVPTCVFVAEKENTTFCATSTFLLTPGLPVYASKDLTNWKLASHALSRESQFGEINLSIAQSDEIWAPTIRSHDVYIITIYRGNVCQKSTGLIFNTTESFRNNLWSRLATSGTDLQTVDVRTGALGERHRIWNGTTGIYLEGPHLYRKDGYYYLLTAEAGWGSITRSPWPALAWRSGPEGKRYPMGREMVLTSVTWKEGDWPSFHPVRGVSDKGWYLAPSKDIPGDGAFVNDPDVVDFEPNSTIPRHFVFWRSSSRDKYTVSPPGHTGTLRLKPSKGSITAGYNNLTYNVDVSFSPQVQNEEIRVTVFINQVQNINLSIVMLPSKNATSQLPPLAPHFRDLVSALGSEVKQNFSQPIIKPGPHSWLDEPVRLIIRAENPENIRSMRLQFTPMHTSKNWRSARGDR
ncbi:glycosyl hydrolase [Aspergillus foveolatus]|uniref:glycosyl hydrolase n=1 Tax=Aspergillus foveolatus TaxID=210207 RepID=UPI003CCD8BFE